MHSTTIYSYLSSFRLSYIMDAKRDKEPRVANRLQLPHNIDHEDRPNLDGASYRVSISSDANGADTRVYLDADTIRKQAESAKGAVDTELELSKAQALAEYEAQKAGIQMRYERDVAMAEASIGQSMQHALFVVEKQHQERRMEIEQKSQEQRLQIEAAANQMIMQAQQQKLQKEMNDRFASLNMNAKNASSYFSGGPASPTFPDQAANMSTGLPSFTQPPTFPTVPKPATFLNSK